MKAVLWIGLIFALLIMGLGGAWLHLGPWMTATVRPAGPPPVIPPGRENVVMAFLGPVVKNGFADLGVRNISLEKSEIRLQLGAKAESSAPAPPSCTLPAWAKAPGMLVIVPDRAPAPPCAAGTACGTAREKDLVLVWAACTSGSTEANAAAEWVSALAQRDHSGIWEMPHDALDEPRATEAGLLTPMVAATGRDKWFVARMLLLISITSSVIAGWVLRWRADRATPKPSVVSTTNAWKVRWGILGALVLVGSGLRMHAAVTLPRDYDEILDGVYTQRILSEDHDSWVHPPLYRAVNKAWVDTTGLDAQDALWKHRIPSLVFSILALCFLAIALGIPKLPWYATWPLALAALSPAVIHDSILARPYGLAMFGATLVLIATSARDLLHEEGDDWFSWLVALVALGLTIWTDLVTSLLVGSFVLARWIDARHFSGNTRIAGRAVIAASVAVWAIPFALGLPGSVQASNHLEKWPFRDSSIASALGQVARLLWEMVGAYGFADQPGWLASLFALAVAGLIAIAALRWTRTAAAVGFALMFAMLALASGFIAMRTRNALFLQVACAFVLSFTIARMPLESIREVVQRWAKR